MFSLEMPVEQFHDSVALACTKQIKLPDKMEAAWSKLDLLIAVLNALTDGLPSSSFWHLTKIKHFQHTLDQLVP